MTAQALPATAPCTPEARVTRSLLGYGVIVGPVYVVTSVVQGMLRPGFDFTRHDWSILANGSWGWIQSANLIVSGLMVAAFAAGVRRALRPGPGSRWAPLLLAAYGAGMAGAGVFRADPALGFPRGTPRNYDAVSWHGALHLVFGAIGFLCLVAGCMVVASRFRSEGRRGWAVYSRTTGILFLAGFGCIASGAHAAWATLIFVAAVVIAFAWISLLSLHLYKR
jgi:hypothetical protein